MLFLQNTNKFSTHVKYVEVGPVQKNLYPGHLADEPAGHPGERRVNPTRQPTHPPTRDPYKIIILIFKIIKYL
jgi:hypothetical protein